MRGLDFLAGIIELRLSRPRLLALELREHHAGMISCRLDFLEDACERAEK